MKTRVQREYRYSVPYADVQWRDGNSPFSNTHQDLYYSADNGLAESEYVFLKLNGLPDRWKQHSRFVIAELGFGTGLNFLNTLKEWQGTSTSHQQLTYISFEKAPLRIPDLQRAHSAFPQLQEQSQLLQSRLQYLHYGINVLQFPKYSTELYLVIGSVEETLPDMHFIADCWYLDGFAPARNEAMWSESILQEVGSHSRGGTTASTFSAARAVREGLTNAGYAVEKVAGWGRKRDSLRAVFVGDTGRSRRLPQKIAVIGGGIAGCSISHALTKSGVQVSLFEAGESLCQGASGNAAAMVKPDYSAIPDARAEISIASFSFLRNLCDYLSLSHEQCQFAGIYRSPQYGRLERLVENFDSLSPDPGWISKINAATAREITGLQTMQAGLFYPNAGWLCPYSLCSAFTRSLETNFATKITAISHETSTWRLRCAQGKTYTNFDAVILANSIAARDLAGDTISGISFNHGQLLSYTGAHWPHPKIPIIGPGYALSANGTLHIGSTFEHTDTTQEAEEKRLDLLLAMEKFLSFPNFHKDATYSNRRSIRCNSSDRLPLIGPLCSEPEFKPHFSTRNDCGTLSHALHTTDHGIYLSVAYGSKGILLAPLLGEVLSSLICATPLPIFKSTLSSLLSTRFLARKLKRN